MEVEIMNAIGQFISSYGFPIVACCVMFWYMNKEREDHKKEVAEMTQAINNNTTVLERLMDKLGA